MNMSDHSDVVRALTRRGKIIAAIIIVVLFGAVFGINWLWHRGEPTYEGVRLSIWLKELNSSSLTPQHQRAIYVLHKLGPAAVPWMLRSIRAAPTRYDQWYSRFWSKL